MLDGEHRLDRADEPFDLALVLRKLGPEDFECHGAVVLRVDGAENDARAAAVDRRADRVANQGRADQLVERGRFGPATFCRRGRGGGQRVFASAPETSRICVSPSSKMSPGFKRCCLTGFPLSLVPHVLPASMRTTESSATSRRQCTREVRGSATCTSQFSPRPRTTVCPAVQIDRASFFGPAAESSIETPCPPHTCSNAARNRGHTKTRSKNRQSARISTGRHVASRSFRRRV